MTYNSRRPQYEPAAISYTRPLPEPIHALNTTADLSSTRLLDRVEIYRDSGTYRVGDGALLHTRDDVVYWVEVMRVTDDSLEVTLIEKSSPPPSTTPAEDEYLPVPGGNPAYVPRRVQDRIGGSLPVIVTDGMKTVPLVERGKRQDPRARTVSSTGRRTRSRLRPWELQALGVTRPDGRPYPSYREMHPATGAWCVLWVDDYEPWLARVAGVEDSVVTLEYVAPVPAKRLTVAQEGLAAAERASAPGRRS